jgi:predicted RNA-binding protein with PIN domain
VADVPGALRPLLGFDRRGMTRGPARTQLRRALETDAHFREQVCAVLCQLPEVQALLDDWRAADALAFANAAALRDDLPLLASALVAAAPEGADFGIGIVLAVDAAAHRARADDDAAGKAAARVVDLEEGLRRADAARAEAERDRDAAAEQLRSERRARRDREKRVAALEGELAQAHARVERAEAALGSARERAEALDAELKETRRVAIVASAPRSAPTPAPAPGPARSGGGAAKRRARPKLPGGLVADTPEGAGAMLRSRSLLLVVDGYNVSKTAGAGGSLELERDWLVRAVQSLHLASGVEAVVVFDGDGTQAPATQAGRGVRVVFSPPGVEADSVVVELVSSAPLPTPVVVASSDRWVREHAETFGAVVVSAATLVAVLRRA